MSETNAAKRIVLPISRWHSDNLGDLLADGSVDIDEVCDRAVSSEQRREAWSESEREFEEWLAANEPLPSVDASDKDEF
ncbi:hypothetical protein H6S82_07515 [Planktothrix sp. FACHB-1355]|uniref:Uncharacterized protein n=1 Tax=Aerosakkonema funiforme FACHB-1375 TaxID=2949571 RepID=A0A926VBZ1_9CYAN|nr:MULTISPECIES: hypothetical protein [Oscillatoriales]MBD2181051.1 hypothetical protein [Aerosakkonema funiforme FACHB-1375]MBD3558702.1 hypothetical protein [Planktothrix sp. FACHB-1355]